LKLATTSRMKVGKVRGEPINHCTPGLEPTR